MASDNETVADAIAAERRRIERAKADAEEDLEIECVFTDEEVGEIIDRIESAHEREVTLQNKRLERVVEDINRTCGLCEPSKKILELRKCLKEAIDMTCENNGTCSDCPIFGETHGDCDVYRWHKALEGENNEGKDEGERYDKRRTGGKA